MTQPRGILFDWVDAFSAQPFGGNGCAVLHNAAHLDAETCKSVVRETSLVECTFTGPSECADWRVRYFLARQEIPFAGHPTLATAAALRARGFISDGPVVFETGAGLIHVMVDGNDISMMQVAPTFGAKVPADVVAAAIGLDPSAIASDPQIVSTGLPFCVTPLVSKEALLSAKLVPDGMRAYFDVIGVEGTDLLEPFLFTQTGATAEGDTFARLLLMPPNPAEDPFTGSATGAMASYLWSKGLIDRPHFVAEQGHGMGRPGRARVEVLGPRDAIEGVRLSGSAYVLMSGEIFVAPQTDL